MTILLPVLPEIAFLPFRHEWFIEVCREQFDAAVMALSAVLAVLPLIVTIAEGWGFARGHAAGYRAGLVKREAFGVAPVALPTVEDEDFVDDAVDDLARIADLVADGETTAAIDACERLRDFIENPYREAQLADARWQQRGQAA